MIAMVASTMTSSSAFLSLCTYGALRRAHEVCISWALKLQGIHTLRQGIITHAFLSLQRMLTKKTAYPAARWCSPGGVDRAGPDVPCMPKL